MDCDPGIRAKICDARAQWRQQLAFVCSGGVDGKRRCDGCGGGGGGGWWKKSGERAAVAMLG